MATEGSWIAQFPGNYYLRAGMYYFTGERFVPPGESMRRFGEHVIPRFRRGSGGST